MKDPNHFINTVAELREVQRQYFRTRIPDYLQKSKKLERRVDKLLEEHYAERRAPKLDL